jgi:hypothetical protein
MPLSRHFYSSDEVQSALLYTTTRNVPSEALFWAEELILSGYHSEAVSILFQSFLWHTGPMRLQWLINAWKLLASDELSEEEILLSTYQLSSIKYSERDTSLWNILVLTIQNPNKMPDTITRKTTHILPSEDEKEIYFIRALFQGKGQSAWWISQYIQEERVWELLDWFAENIHTKYTTQYKICLEALKCYEKLLGYKSTEYDFIIRCAAILMMCINVQQQEKSFKPLASEIDSDNLKTLNEWSATVGRRERRVYSIPTGCLYGTTLRGRIKWSQNNLTQLYDIEKHLVGSPYWDNVLTDYAKITEDNKINWFSDDKMEEFYNTYFPDDLPDEWNKKDKLQSHGDGVLAPNDTPNIGKFSRNYLSKISHFSYNTTKEVNSILDGLSIEDCSLERIVEYFNEPLELSEEDLKRLRPVRKIKVV